jgi:hypothetical protein
LESAASDSDESALVGRCFDLESGDFEFDLSSPFFPLVEFGAGSGFEVDLRVSSGFRR